MKKKDNDEDPRSDYGRSHMKGWIRGSYNDNKKTNTGEYRSHEDYVESGGPVDPCDDALWLHDQE